MSFDDDKPPTPVGRVEVAVHGSKKKDGKVRRVHVVRPDAEGSGASAVTGSIDHEGVIAGAVKKTVAETAGVKGYIACAGEGCAAVVERTSAARKYCRRCIRTVRREGWRAKARKERAENPAAVQTRVADAKQRARVRDPEAYRAAHRRHKGKPQRPDVLICCVCAALFPPPATGVLPKTCSRRCYGRSVNPEHRARAREYKRAYKARKKAEREAAAK